MSNRVAEIQKDTQSSICKHVPPPEIPVDLVSRGMLPHEFLDASLWKHGLTGLQQRESLWLNQNIVKTYALEQRKLYWC